MRSWNERISSCASDSRAAASSLRESEARERAVELMNLTPELLDLAVRAEQGVAHARELAIAGFEHRASLLELRAHRGLGPLALVQLLAMPGELPLELLRALLGFLPPPIAIVCALLHVRALDRKAADLAFRPLDLAPEFRDRLLELRDLLVSRFELTAARLDLRALREQPRLEVRERTLGGVTRCGGLVGESGLLGECLTCSLELGVELLGALPRLRCRGAELLEVAARLRHGVAFGGGALARGFDLRRQLDDPLLALAEHRAHPFRRGEGLASGALRGLELGARSRELGLRRRAGGVCLVERLVERSDLARQCLDSRLNLERLLGRGVVIGVVRGGELGLELIDLTLALGELRSQTLDFRVCLGRRLGRGCWASIRRRHRHAAGLRLRVAQLLDQRVALDDLAAQRSEPVAVLLGLAGELLRSRAPEVHLFLRELLGAGLGHL